MYYESNSVNDTLSFARALGHVLRAGDVLCLSGELGTGKTVFVKGIASALGYSGEITSPTFTIIHPYPEIGLCHVDAFRLGSARELVEAGLEEYLDGDWICAVEWAEKVRDALPDRALLVLFEFAELENSRRIAIRPEGGWDGRANSILRGF